MRKVLLPTVIMANLVFLGGDPVFGYEEIEVTDGGTISGKVTFAGTIEVEEQLAVTKNQDHCGGNKPSEVLMIGPNNGVRNVVVTIDGITQGKEVDKTARPFLDNKECLFVPHVQSVTVGRKVEIRNSDPILHNTHAFLGNRTVFNLALPLEGQKILKRIKRPGILSIRCDAGHTWMSAYIVAVDHPYHATTDESGRFEISDIPPGSYTLKAWHEKLGVTEQDIEVKAKEETEVSFSY